MAKYRSKIKLIIGHLKKKRVLIIVGAIFLLAIFLRFFEINERSPFGWDQVDNAWAAMRLLVEGKFPLLGMQAKGNSGVFIGPFYYYFVSIFYFLTNLDPVALGIIAGITSIFSLVAIYVIAKRIFNETVAIFAIFINTVSVLAITSERVQWPVNFIAVIALLIFYSLYEIARGKSKYILLLALTFGFSLHIHFTSIFYPIIILLSLPFFPRTKETLRYIGLGFLIVIPFIIPTAISLIHSSQQASSISSYGSSYYHGFHLRRVSQLIGDAVIQFTPYLYFKEIKILQFLLLPLFFTVYLYKKISRDRLLLCYLCLLFFVVPWFVLSTYSGELTDYYFLASRFIALIVISYLLYRVFNIKSILIKILVIVLLLMYGVLNIRDFLNADKSNSINNHRSRVMESINKGQFVEYQEGSPETYLYYYYMRKNGKKVY